MKFNFKKRSIKWASLIVSVTLVTFFACKRTADVQNTNESFGVEQAKEWYYAYFNKSVYFKKLNTKSPFISNANKSLNTKVNDAQTSNLIKSPKWSLAKNFTRNGLQIVEMPILYNVTTVLLPGTQNESDNTKKQMANASLNKILFIKQPNGNVAIRLVTIVPTVAYATSKNFDISTNSCDNLDNNFSGYVMVKKWDETPVTTTKILNGTACQKVTMVKRTDNNISGKLNNSNNLREESQTQEPCDPWIWVPKVYKTCAIAYQGDEPDHECEEWNQIESPTEGTWEYNPACEDTGEFDEEDLCSLFGIGCPDDEDDDPCEMYGIGCSGEEVDCNALEEQYIEKLEREFNEYVQYETPTESVDFVEPESTFSSQTIYDYTKPWVVAKGKGWKIAARTKIGLQFVHPRPSNNLDKTLTITHVESKFVGWNNTIITTWTEGGHEEKVFFNNIPKPMGQAKIWGSVRHVMKTEGKVNLGVCEFEPKVGLDKTDDVNNTLPIQ